MQIMLYFTLLLAFNYLLLSFYGKSLLLLFKQQVLKALICSLFVLGLWLFSSLISYGFMLIAINSPIKTALSPIFFILVFSTGMGLLLKYFKWFKLDIVGDFASLLLAFNSIMLSLTFLFNHNIVLLMVYNIVTILAVLLAIIIAISIIRCFILDNIPKKFYGIPIILIITVLLLLSLSFIEG